MLQKQAVIFFLERTAGLTVVGKLAELATAKTEYGYTDDTYAEIRQAIVRG